jgi:microcystin-dependent protein
MTLYKWSQTASADATADSTINWAEGQAPSSLNDSGRAMMAATAKYRDDIAGAITTGGTATAYTVSSFQVFDTLGHLSGQNIAFVPHATNTNAVGVDVTLNVDGLGAKSIRMAPSIALPNGTLVLGTPYIVTYNNSDSVFYLQNMTNPYSIPLAGGMDFWGTTTPNSSFAFPTGQAISRTTYATLFSIMSTTYGSGDGSTTFNLPDKTGRISAMKEGSATRLTSTYFGGNSTNMGAVGGLESQTLTLAQLPTGITTTGTVTVGTNLLNLTVVTGTLGTQPSPSTGGNTVPTSTASWTTTKDNFTGTNTLTSNNTSGSAHNITQPTIICNYIIRII